MTSDQKTCGVCGGPRGGGWPDSCIGWLAGVAWACCGHGRDEWRYISTTNGRRFGGFQTFQEYARWRTTPEGETVVSMEKYEAAFGWDLGNRRLHERCGLPQYECVCTYGGRWQKGGTIEGGGLPSNRGFREP